MIESDLAGLSELTTHRETVPTTQATQQTRHSPSTHVM